MDTAVSPHHVASDDAMKDIALSAVAFDTLKLSDRLQAGGFSVEQARTAAAALAEALSGAELGTKADLRDLEQRLTIRLGGMLVVAVGVLLAAMKYLPPH